MTAPASGGARARIDALAHALEHVLPAQAPIRDFVHHNTLHGFQHLPFRDALAEAARRMGTFAFLSRRAWREMHEQGRIHSEDLRAALRDAEEDADRVVVRLAGRALTRADIGFAAMTHDLAPVTAARLRWWLEEQGADARWPDCLEGCGLARDVTGDGAGHDPGDLAGTGTGNAEGDGVPFLADEQARARIEVDIRHAGARLADALLDRVGRDWTLRDLLRALSGEDLMDELRPWLVRHLAAHLDQGLAAGANPAAGRGFFAAWRESVQCDALWNIADLPEWRQIVQRLPEDAATAVARELELLGLDRERHDAYLETLAMELPGWSGMFLWRHAHPGYAGLTVPVDLADYLAVRLAMERMFAHALARRLWRVEPTLPVLRWHMRHQPAELIVRHALYSGELPESMAARASMLAQYSLLARARPSSEGWLAEAARILAWRDSPDPLEQAGRRAWPLLRLTQALALSPDEFAALTPADAEALLAELEGFDEARAGWVGLLAYERNYRERIFAALAANHGRGPWRTRASRPEAQLTFCMDDREEGLRRHLEELNPRVETLGAAGFYNVPMHWRGLDDAGSSALCPVVMTPAHDVREVARVAEAGRAHAMRRARRMSWKARLYQGGRLGLTRPLLALAAAPAVLVNLAWKLARPASQAAFARRMRASIEREVVTDVAFTTPPDAAPATVEAPRAGFTDPEQAERVFTLLRNIGLTSGFAPLVVILGHGSHSQNNPHLSAYDCGACSGRHGGPNARVFCAMANRPEVRARLGERGVIVPDDTWFVAGERDTCDDTIAWYDLDRMPETFRPAFERLRGQLDTAAQHHARERCRRLASAPLTLSPPDAHRHVLGRAADFSQARPELGHATNACAFIGRRAMSRGAFFDRRSFLISYDPDQDPDGTVLEPLLLANGPVGAGISLEYYFSSVNNERLGCGTKVMHNVAGLFGVMDGASSDLRTGLPRQMIEIHEPMRLLVVVEHRVEVITAIYQRQPPLQELIGNGWIVVAAKDPDSPAIHLFDPARGWLPWEGRTDLATVECSEDWFAGRRDALPPALLRRPVAV